MIFSIDAIIPRGAVGEGLGDALRGGIGIRVMGSRELPALKAFLSDWHNLLPVAGIVVPAGIGIFLWLRRKPEDTEEMERRRRAHVNRVGRIVEGRVLEIAEQPRHSPPGTKKGKQGGPLPGSGVQKLLHYTYSISGVSYETAQDVTGLEERLHLTRIAAGQIASVKYDPSNPSNSILIADDWSGLH